jgi:hypothetical protein
MRSRNGETHELNGETDNVDGGDSFCMASFVSFVTFVFNLLRL